MSSSIHDNKIIIYLAQDNWRNICHSKNSRQVEAHHLLNTMIILMMILMLMVRMINMLMATKKMMSLRMEITSPITSWVWGSLYLDNRYKNLLDIKQNHLAFITISPCDHIIGIIKIPPCTPSRTVLEPDEPILFSSAFQPSWLLIMRCSVCDES